MPTSTLIPDDQDQDVAHNIAQQKSDQLANRFSYQEQHPDRVPGITNTDGFGDGVKNENKDNAEQTRQLEQNATGTPGAQHINNVTAKPTKKKSIFKLRLKRDGPITGIIVILLGLLGIGGTLFAPGLGIIQMKEVLTRDLNDQLSAMNIRSEAVFKAKLSNMSRGICTGVKIQCKFTSMSQRQIDKFKKQGFVIADEDLKTTVLGRKIITFMTAPDGTAIRNPADLATARKNSPVVRSALNRVFNPLYYGLSDKVANSFFERNKTNKQKKVSSGSDEENRRALAEATSGERASAGGSVELTDEKGKYVTNENGTRIYEGDPGYAEAKASAEARLTSLQSTPDAGKALSGFLGGAGRAVNIVGTADSACTVYNLGRAVGATAKVARSMQLIQFAMIINSTADSIKAGDATPEEVEFIGKMLTETDNRKQIINESTEQLENNPNYGKAAFDSAGYKTAAYNDAPTLSVEAQQYMVGGGLSGSLSSIMDTVNSQFVDIRQSCGVIQNPWVRGAGLIVGIIVGIGSFGAGTAIMAGASVAVSFAIPVLEAMLADIVAGKVVGEDISGVDAGNAMFAGSGAMLGGIAQNRGMTPLSSEGIQEYAAATQEATSEYIAMQRYDASQTPMDITNEYSFLGSLTRSLYPSALKAQSSASGAITSVGSVIQTGLSSLTKSASANEAFNADRFSKCNDPGYEELGIDADIFCNVRYGLTEAELTMDAEEVMNFMLSSGNINEEGEPQNKYAEFMKNCVNRVDGWGDTSNPEGSPSIGKECIDGNPGFTYENISYFRVFTMDNSISEAMDDEVAPESASAPPAGSGQYVLPVDPGFSAPSRFGPRAGGYHRGIDFRGYPGGALGKPVYAVADGEVIEADKSNGSGGRCTSSPGSTQNNVVRIKHADGAITWYVHMSPGAISVDVGDKVTAGQLIGAMNTCGNSTGPHLHFAAEPGDATDPRITSIPLDTRDNYFINPETYMSLYGVDLYNGTYTDGRQP